MLTGDVIVRHPRSLLLLAFTQFAAAVQILIFGMICKFYDGCPYATAIWTACVFVMNTVLGVIFLKMLPKRPLLVCYFASSVVGVLLSIVLFAISAWLIDCEDRMLREKGWDAIKEHLFQLNRILENTKIAMYSLHMVLAPIHGKSQILLG